MKKIKEITYHNQQVAIFETEEGENFLSSVLAPFKCQFEGEGEFLNFSLKHGEYFAQRGLSTFFVVHPYKVGRMFINFAGKEIIEIPAKKENTERRWAPKQRVIVVLKPTWTTTTPLTCSNCPEACKLFSTREEKELPKNCPKRW